MHGERRKYEDQKIIKSLLLTLKISQKSKKWLHFMNKYSYPITDYIEINRVLSLYLEPIRKIRIRILSVCELTTNRHEAY